MAKNSKALTIIATAVITAIVVGLFSALIAGVSVYYLQNLKIQKLEVQTQKLKKEIADLKQAKNPQTNQNTETANWLDYNNDRFGFSIKYPLDWHKSESANEDGITLTQESEELRIYGVKNVDNLSLKDYLDKNFPMSINIKNVKAGDNAGYSFTETSDAYYIFQNATGDFILFLAPRGDNKYSVKTLDKIAQTLILAGQ